MKACLWRNYYKAIVISFLIKKRQNFESNKSLGLSQLRRPIKLRSRPGKLHNGFTQQTSMTGGSNGLKFNLWHHHKPELRNALVKYMIIK